MEVFVEPANDKETIYIERTSKNSYCTTYGTYKTFRSMKEVMEWAESQGNIEIVVHDFYKLKQEYRKNNK